MNLGSENEHLYCIHSESVLENTAVAFVSATTIAAIGPIAAIGATRMR